LKARGGGGKGEGREGWYGEGEDMSGGEGERREGEGEIK